MHEVRCTMPLRSHYILFRTRCVSDLVIYCVERVEREGYDSKAYICVTLHGGSLLSRCMLYGMRSAVCWRCVAAGCPLFCAMAYTRRVPSWSMSECAAARLHFAWCVVSIAAATIHLCVAWCALLVSSCTLHVAAFPYRNCRVIRCMACCLCAARLGEGQALRLPSGGAMPSCAVPCRRRGDHHLQGHRAVRHRGDI